MGYLILGKLMKKNFGDSGIIDMRFKRVDSHAVRQSNITDLFTLFGRANLEFFANDLPTICFTNWVRAS